jgi:hypothetical protein
MRFRSRWSLHPYLAGLPLRDVITLPNIAYSETLDKMPSLRSVILSMKLSKVVKIQTYCPKESADKVRLAIGKAGGGVIGNYTYCAFLSGGHGYFLPMEGSNPTIGKRGMIEKVPEVKIEFVCE